MRIVYLILNPKGEETYQDIMAGHLPSDRMYGLVELKKLGYDVTFKCMRPRGKVSRFLNKRLSFNIPGISAIKTLLGFDVVVVNGPFSTLITFACKLMNKKLVYLDTILRLPSNPVRRLLYKINIILSDSTIMYSKSQLELCANFLKVPLSSFKLIPFSIDFPFYERIKHHKKTTTPFILSVGRDQARDYKTLVEAVDGLAVKTKLLTLSYLLKDVDLHSSSVDVLENVSYNDLYQLYAEAQLVVIPLKKWGTAYSSGTRALLEAMALGKRVIASASDPLKEYAMQDEGVHYVEAENVEELRNAISTLLSKNDDSLGIKGRQAVKEKYNIENFGNAFGTYLSELYRG